MRVRTTSLRLAPAFARAASMFLIVCTVCARASPTPMILPSGPVAVVPDTVITLPILTAREYPTIGSHDVPLEIFCLRIAVSPQENSKHNPMAAISTLVSARIRRLGDDAKLNAIRCKTEAADEVQPHPGSRGPHAAGPSEPHHQRPEASDLHQSGIHEPWRLGEGPHRPHHDRRCREKGFAEAGL